MPLAKLSQNSIVWKSMFSCTVKSCHRFFRCFIFRTLLCFGALFFSAPGTIAFPSDDTSASLQHLRRAATTFEEGIPSVTPSVSPTTLSPTIFTSTSIPSIAAVASYMEVSPSMAPSTLGAPTHRHYPVVNWAYIIPVLGLCVSLVAWSLKGSKTTEFPTPKPPRAPRDPLNSILCASVENTCNEVNPSPLQQLDNDDNQSWVEMMELKDGESSSSIRSFTAYDLSDLPVASSGAITTDFSILSDEE